MKTNPSLASNIVYIIHITITYMTPLSILTIKLSNVNKLNNKTIASLKNDEQ
jgi:hypothetical protein